MWKCDQKRRQGLGGKDEEEEIEEEADIQVRRYFTILKFLIHNEEPTDSSQ